MTMTVIGLKRKSGEFQGKPYDNFFVDVAISDPANETIIAGCNVAEFKIRADNFLSAMGRNIGALNSPNVKEAKDIIGLLFLPAYSEFKGVTTDFTLAVPEKKK